MKQLFTFFVLTVTYCMVPVSAEVIDKAANGFHIKVSVEVNASQQKSYRQFLRVHEWWDGKHSWFGDAKNFSIDPRAGGCFCETKDDSSVLHMTVTYVKPNQEIRMLGGLGPLQMMGLHGAMSFSFEYIGEEKTKILHEYRVSGYTKDGLQSLADAVDRVQTHQLKRLQARFK